MNSHLTVEDCLNTLRETQILHQHTVEIQKANDMRRDMIAYESYCVTELEKAAQQYYSSCDREFLRQKIGTIVGNSTTNSNEITELQGKLANLQALEQTQQPVPPQELRECEEKVTNSKSRLDGLINATQSILLLTEQLDHHIIQTDIDNQNSISCQTILMSNTKEQVFATPTLIQVDSYRDNPIAPLDLPVSFSPARELNPSVAPPFFEYGVTIPYFTQSHRATDQPYVDSCLFETQPFPFKWRLRIWPSGVPTGRFTSDSIAVGIRLEESWDPQTLQYAQTIFPVCGPKDKPDETTHPLYFDVMVRILSELPSDSRLEQKVHQIQYFKSNKFSAEQPQCGTLEFMKNDVLRGGRFLWKSQADAHFVFGWRFPSYKRMAEAYHLCHIQPRLDTSYDNYGH
ncbi:hypothetical protein BLNAU_344 [Blattamonas nauphoetae]|uniref:Uncharacterized protein n=1 Tax=Blattamonas nauphoetae TaxID=2049346 RepID=A0ABQ9YKZ6_9EUKA|nr:hypothetical protein BLNAU_344 [Blattamonas nauphoetae]